MAAKIVRHGTGGRAVASGVRVVASGGLATRRAYEPPRLRCRTLVPIRSALAMGQSITVVEKQTPKPGIVRFETNRTLSGMGHERYYSAADATGVRPVDELARRLFAHGGVDSIHIYSNV